VYPKPETFNFLGFTFYGSSSEKTGKFVVKMKTNKSKFRAKVKEFKEWMRKARNVEVKDIIKAVNAKLRGHYRYYGVTHNIKELKSYFQIIRKMLYKWLNRRSQRKSFTWDEFEEIEKTHWHLEKPKIYVNLFG